MCTQIEINGQLFGTTIGMYLDSHFAAGPSARPRSYFYPDYPIVFQAPKPPEALHEIVNSLIDFAEKLATAVNH
jgi:hypothetical protein